jgi:hypothetical protein
VHEQWELAAKKKKKKKGRALVAVVRQISLRTIGSESEETLLTAMLRKPGAGADRGAGKASIGACNSPSQHVLVARHNTWNTLDVFCSENISALFIS